MAIDPLTACAQYKKSHTKGVNTQETMKY